MADNTELSPGSGGDVMRTDEVNPLNHVKIPASKWFVGGVGVDGGPVTETNPGPVQIAQDGTFVSVPLKSQAVTALANQASSLANEATQIAILEQIRDGLPTDPPTTVTANQGTAGVSPWPVDVSDRIARLLGHVEVDSSVLPSGAATSANQSTTISALASIFARQADGTQLADVTDRIARLLGHVIVDSSALPSGAATEAKQDSGNASLVSIDGKIPASPSEEHVLATDPHAVRLTDGASFYDARQVRALTAADVISLASGSATIGKVDQGLGGASAWKVDGSAVTQPVSAVSLPLPSGAATEATIVNRLGPATGFASGALSAAGPTTLYTPASGQRVRLKWLHVASLSSNTVDVICTIKIGLVTVYQFPLSNPGVFQRSSTRLSTIANDAVTISLSPAGQTVYVNGEAEDY